MNRYRCCSLYLQRTRTNSSGTNNTSKRLHLIENGSEIYDKNLVEFVGSEVIFQIGVYGDLFGLGIALSKLDISNSVFQKLRDF